MKLREVGDQTGRYWQRFLAPIATLSLVCSIVAPIAYAHGDDDIDCDVVIIGGGPGGVHTAYRLATLPNTVGVDKRKVCVIEKENRLGGRVEDVELGKNGEIIPLGAMRAPEYQYTHGLLNELGIAMNPQLSHMTLLGILNPNGVNGLKWGNSTNDFSSYYQQDPGLGDTEIAQKLVCGAQVPKINPTLGDGGEFQFEPNLEGCNALKGKTISEYATTVLGTKGFKYLRDTSTFKADFKAPYNGKEQDALSYAEYLANDWDTGAVDYPANGFSEAIKIMADQAKLGGVKFYMNEAVESINKQWGTRPYKIKTSKDRVFNAKRVIIATTADVLKDDISGGITEDIIVQKEYKAAESGHAIATTITNQWNMNWWDKTYTKSGKTYQYVSQPSALAEIDNSDADTQRIRRGGMTNVTWGGGYCLTRLEMSTQKVWRQGQVTRTAYIDDPECALKWYNLYKQGGVNAVNNKLNEGLQIIFPRVFDPNKNQEFVQRFGKPKILDSAVIIHKFAWNALGEGSWNPPQSKLTNQKVWDWSVQPLNGEAVYLVGDSWVPSNGWSAAAFMGSVRVLNEKFGMNVPLHDEEVPTSANGKYPKFARVLCECENAAGTGDCEFYWYD
ncbi:MAG: FAD-dependent oxidoreductase [Legionella sp.]|nr:MAG: FAD-dependent oxidoreductase [Legionella sp.]